MRQNRAVVAAPSDAPLDASLDDARRDLGGDERPVVAVARLTFATRSARHRVMKLDERHMKRQFGQC